MNTLSQRTQDGYSVELALLKRGFDKCLSSPYHRTDNPNGIINLGTSENLICNDLVIPKLESFTHISPEEMRYFPINGMPEFRKEIGKFLGNRSNSDVEMDMSDLTIMNGCSSIFNFLAYVIGNQGDYFLVPSPYYGMAADYMKGYMGLNPIAVDLDEDNMVSVESLQLKYDEAVLEGKKVCGLVLINPHNPTGAVYDKKLVVEVMEFASARGIHMIVDEIYLLSVFEEGVFESCLSYSLQWPDPDRTHFMWSFSKDFAMSGARCAVLYTKNRAIHATFDRMAFYHSVPAMVQMKLCAMLRDTQWVDDFLAESRVRLKDHANVVMESLDKLGIPYLKPIGTLFLWADFTPVFRNRPSQTEADSIFLEMLNNLIYIPSARGFNGIDPKNFRIVYAIPKDDLMKAMSRLEEFVCSYKNGAVECVG